MEMYIYVDNMCGTRYDLFSFGPKRWVLLFTRIRLVTSIIKKNEKAVRLKEEKIVIVI